MAFYDPVSIVVHVLLVDHDATSLVATGNLLEHNLYKVTAVQDPSVALQMLSEGNKQFDLVMVDVNSSDSQEFKLFQEVVNMGKAVIVMSSNGNPTLAKCAIEDGAFLFIKKPVPVDVLKYLWQHIYRERTRKAKEIKKGKSLCGETSMIPNIGTNQTNHPVIIGGNLGENMINQDIITNEHESNNMNEMAFQNHGGFFEMGDTNNININESDKNDAPRAGGNRNKRKVKVWVEWTQDLHEKFMEAVKTLGDGKCFPREIMDLMNVPGLTRMQVASHLQKCRVGRLPPQEGKPRRIKAAKTTTSAKKRSKPSKYGMLPRSGRGIQTSKPGGQDNNNRQDDDQGISSGISEEIKHSTTPCSDTDQNTVSQRGTIALDITTTAPIVSDDNNPNINKTTDKQHTLFIEPVNSKCGDFSVEPDNSEGGLFSDLMFNDLTVDDCGLITDSNFDFEDIDLGRVLAEIQAYYNK